MKPTEKGSADLDCDMALFPHFANLSADTLDALNDISRTRDYRDGQTVIRAGETPGFIGCVKSGYLRMQKTLLDGRQHIVGLLTAGDLFATDDGAPAGFDIEAATEAEICAFPRSRFHGVRRSAPELDRALHLCLFDELHRSRNWLVVLSNHRVRGRLAGFLILMSARPSGSGRDGREVHVPISRADLANLLGTRPESLSRAFHGLEDAGVIEILRPDLVRIVEPEWLARELGDHELAEHLTARDVSRRVGRPR